MENIQYIATVYTDNGYYYLGPDNFANVKNQLIDDLSEIDVIKGYIYEFNDDTSMPDGDPVGLYLNK
tara:strand:+ start:106 stop:306 length:201 start_codon:yes stop_codon:yes gene_type:complete